MLEENKKKQSIIKKIDYILIAFQIIIAVALGVKLFLREKNRLIFPALNSHSFRTMKRKILIPSRRFWRNIMLPKMCIQESGRNPLI